MKKHFIIAFLAVATSSFAQSKLKPALSQKADALKSKVIAWRRDFHEHPELGNQEFR
ncbi:MAG: hypothetical protein RI995_2001, partial [Bacteroidota bacterium]